MITHLNQIKNKKLNDKYNDFFENKEYELFTYEILEMIEIE